MTTLDSPAVSDARTSALAVDAVRKYLPREADQKSVLFCALINLLYPTLPETCGLFIGLFEKVQCESDMDRALRQALYLAEALVRVKPHDGVV